MTDPTPTTRTETHTVVDIEIPGGSTLRISRVEDGPEGPTLILAHGFGGGNEPFRRPDWCGTPIRLPAAVLPQLQPSSARNEKATSYRKSAGGASAMSLHAVVGDGADLVDLRNRFLFETPSLVPEVLRLEYRRADVLLRGLLERGD